MSAGQLKPIPQEAPVFFMMLLQQFHGKIQVCFCFVKSGARQFCFICLQNNSEARSGLTVRVARYTPKVAKRHCKQPATLTRLKSLFSQKPYNPQEQEQEQYQHQHQQQQQQD
jgi:hypothetical protein